MSRRTRPSALKKTFTNVMRSSLSETDKNCVAEVFRTFARYKQENQSLREELAEIERLQKELSAKMPSEEYPFKVKVGNNSEIHSKSIEDYDRLLIDISAETIKDFANEFEHEILHKEFWNDHPYTGRVWLNGYEQCMRDIRVILKDKLKEMADDTK
jgi:hypothetical protein